MDKSLMRSRGAKFAIILGVSYVVYNAVLFLLVGFLAAFTVSFWTSYIMMTIAFIAVGITNLATMNSRTESKDLLLKVPVIKYSVLYLVIELIVSTASIILGLTSVPWFISLPVQIVILGVYVIITVISIFAKGHIHRIDDKVRDKTTFTKLLKVDIDMIVEKAEDPEVREAFINLSEQVRYSDPMSNENLFELEKQILQCISYADRCVSENKKEAALKNCEIASRMLFERNQKTQALK